MSDFVITEGSVPGSDVQDEKPDTTPNTDGVSDSDNPNNWYNPDFPYSSEEHPYGYFPDRDGNPDFNRPRKNKPRGYGGTAKSGKGFPASDKSARAAAKLLSQMNLFVGMGISAFGLRMTAQSLVEANEGFEEMAYNALLTDPKLCQKILSAGATSGKTQLMFAYVALAGSIAPAAMEEVRELRTQRAAQREAEAMAEGYVA